VQENRSEYLIMPQNYLPLVTKAIRDAASASLPAELTTGQSFVFDLGFDSLAMARLGLALEEQLGCPILLDPWLSSQSDPSALTIGSLCEFVQSRLEAHEGA
jgi:acyl carrier protein